MNNYLLLILSDRPVILSLSDQQVRNSTAPTISSDRVHPMPLYDWFFQSVLFYVLTTPPITFYFYLA